MRSNVGRRSKLPSPLAVDLALSHANLAALKAKTRLRLNQEELRSVQDLKEYFQVTLQTLEASRMLPSRLVRERETRNQLEATLATLPTPPTSQQKQDIELYKRLAKLLGVLARDRTLKPADATRLLGSLGELEGRSEQAMRLPKLREFLAASR